MIFQSPLFGDVHDGAGGKDRRTVVVHDDPPAVAQPPYVAVGSDDAKLEAVVGTRGNGGVDGVTNTRAIVRMDAGERRVVEPARRLPRLQPENAVQVLVVHEHARAEVDVPCAHAGGAERRP